jgi:5-methyltetrahydrofolate--homocysteine methyltransferase
MNIAFTNNDWQRIEKDYTAWWKGELERPLIFIEGYKNADKAVMKNAPYFPGHLPLDIPIDEVVDRYSRKLECMRWYGDGFPFWWPNFGPGVVSAFAGLARMDVSTEHGTIWFEPHKIEELADLKISFDGTNPLWKHVKELTRCAAKRWAGKVCVGYPDFGGNLDILAVLRSTGNLLMDTMDEPDVLKKACQQVTKVWLQCFDEIHEVTKPGHGHSSWGPIWAPGSTFMLQSDFAYMIAPEMFEEFVMPDLEACCEHIEYPFYHLDGKGQLPHLDLLCSMEKMRGIQWVPGSGVPPAVEWPDVLRKITDSGKLCQIYATPEEAVQFYKEYDGRGTQVWITSPMEESDALDLLDAIKWTP